MMMLIFQSMIIKDNCTQQSANEKNLMLFKKVLREVARLLYFIICMYLFVTKKQKLYIKSKNYTVGA